MNSKLIRTKTLMIFSVVLFSFMACEKEAVSPTDTKTDQALDFRAPKDKVDICHYSEDEDTWHVINVSLNALDAHLAHGDAVDMDGDGFFHLDNECGATDCDDSNAEVNPNATEVPYDGVDNDCDPSTPDDDLDGDGFNQEDDCDDTNAAVNPDAAEDCTDGIDNNCDGLTDDEDEAACGVDVQIGDEIAGGIVFYVADTPVDLNGDGTPDQGLVAALTDQTPSCFFGVPWGNFQEAGCWDTNISGADGTAIGTGKQNTDDILAACSNMPDQIAASLASSYDGGGYSDWFLPSQGELYLMWENLAQSGLGDFCNNYYWSSSEFSDTPFDARWVHMGATPPSNPFNSRTWYTSKNFNFLVRAVRAF